MIGTKTVAVSLSLAFLAVAAGCGNKNDEHGGRAPGPGSAAGGNTAAGPGSAASGGAATSGAAATGGAATGGGAAPGGATGGAAPGGSGSAGGAAPAAQRHIAAQEGATCPKGTQRVTDVPIKLDGTILSFKRGRGGGCAERPSYLALYTRANPMSVTVCFDPGADMCEMYIVDEPVAIDLAPALAAAGATAAVLAK